MTDEEMNSVFSQLWALAYRISMLPLAPMGLEASARAMRGYEDAADDLILLRAVAGVIKAISGKEHKSAPQGEVELFALTSGSGAVVIKKSLEEARETKEEIDRWASHGWGKAKIYRLVGTVVE